LGLMSHGEKGALAVGFVVGVFALVVFLALSDLTYFDGVTDFKEEAVASGHAEWVIETNESGEPEMKFQWKQSK